MIIWWESIFSSFQSLSEGCILECHLYHGVHFVSWIARATFTSDKCIGMMGVVGVVVKWCQIINNAREAALNLHQTGRTSSFVHTTSWEDSHHSSPSDILPISKIGQPRLSTGPLQEDPCPRSDNSTSSALVRGPCTGGSHNETTNSNSEVGPPTNLPTVHADFNRDSIGDLPSEKKRIVRQVRNGDFS